MKTFVLLPAEGDVFAVQIVRRGARLKVGHVEVGERVIDEAVHGAVRAVHVLVYEPRDEV